MQESVKNFLKEKNFAICGSFRNKTKYAYKILKALKKKGYNVYPVNPRLKEVEGLKCYASLKDIPERIDVADIVTPPAVTEKIVEECSEIGIKKVWLQPGAESEKALSFCADNGISVIHGLCIILESL